MFEPPHEIPDYQLKMYWHKINGAKASYQWLCQQIKDIEWAT